MQKEINNAQIERIFFSLESILSQYIIQDSLQSYRKSRQFCHFSFQILLFISSQDMKVFRTNACDWIRKTLRFIWIDIFILCTWNSCYVWELLNVIDFYATCGTYKIRFILNFVELYDTMQNTLYCRRRLNDN